MRMKRTGPGQYAMVGRRREDGKLVKREKAEAEALERLGLEQAAKLYGMKVNLGSGKHGELSIEEAQRELGVLQAAGRPYKLPGHYGKPDPLHTLLVQAGIIKTR